MIKRLFEILSKIIRLYFYWFFNNGKNDFHKKFAVKTRKALEDLGPTFIKLGQTLSMRPDFIPSIYCTELEKCLDSAPAIPVSVIIGIVEKDLGKSLEEIFHDFDKNPIAAASLSQVHKAVLPNKEVVAVKVLRPGLHKVIKKDIRILRRIIKLFGNQIGNVGKNYWLDLANQIEDWLSQETDYKKEIKNIETMRREFEELDNIIIPKAYSEISTKNVLVMEFISGYSMIELIHLKRKNKLPEFDFSLKEKVVEIIDVMGIRSLRHGYIHADLHPANIIITKDGKIAFLDFGLIQYFDKCLKKGILFYMMGVAFSSPELVFKAIYMTADIDHRVFDKQSLYKDLSGLLDRHRGAPAKDMSNGRLLIEGLNICLSHGVRFAWPMILYSRSSASIDGVILNICPEFVFSSYSQYPLLKIYAQNTVDEVVNIPSFISAFEDAVSVFREVPSVLKKVFEDIIVGKDSD